MTHHLSLRCNGFDGSDLLVMLGGSNHTVIDDLDKARWPILSTSNDGTGGTTRVESNE